jgi:hypothetical protein
MMGDTNDIASSERNEKVSQVLNEAFYPNANSLQGLRAVARHSAVAVAVTPSTPLSTALAANCFAFPNKACHDASCSRVRFKGPRVNASAGFEMPEMCRSTTCAGKAAKKDCNRQYAYVLAQLQRRRRVSGRCTPPRVN